MGTSDLTTVNRLDFSKLIRNHKDWGLRSPEWIAQVARLYKVVPCTMQEPHFRKACPCSHPHEELRRRDPCTALYLPLPCPDYSRDGVCVRGDFCPWAHGTYEVGFHPWKFKTEMCRYGPYCTRSVCYFAHDKSELQFPALPLLELIVPRLQQACYIVAEKPAISIHKCRKLSDVLPQQKLESTGIRFLWIGCEVMMFYLRFLRWQYLPEKFLADYNYAQMNGSWNPRLIRQRWRAYNMLRVGSRAPFSSRYAAKSADYKAAVLAKPKYASQKDKSGKAPDKATLADWWGAASNDRKVLPAVSSRGLRATSSSQKIRLA